MLNTIFPPTIKPEEKSEIVKPADQSKVAEPQSATIQKSEQTPFPAMSEAVTPIPVYNKSLVEEELDSPKILKTPTQIKVDDDMDHADPWV